MDACPFLDDAERALALGVLDDFTSSLDLEALIANARERLGRLIPLDALALCVSRPPGDALGYDWMPFGLSSAFFHHYPEVASHDFVQGSTTRAPNTVLRESQMISRERLIRNPMYERLRELGQPIERCMSVALCVDPAWHGGLTLYRAGRKPFSRHQQAVLQWLTPRLARSIGHCRTFGAMRTQAAMLSEMLERQVPCVLVRGPRLEQWEATPRARAMLEEWFSPAERQAGLPREFRVRLESLARQAGGLDDAPLEWVKSGVDKTLGVRFEPLPSLGGERAVLIRLKERQAAIPLPESWRSRLSKREAEVVALAFRFWDYQTIAEHLRIKEDTVKQHLDAAYDELGADNLKKLMANALSEG